MSEKVLVWKNKYEDYLVFARTEEEELLAYLHLFKLMDRLDFYGWVESFDQIQWIKEARDGNCQSAKNLIETRIGYEYERVDVSYVFVPEVENG